MSNPAYEKYIESLEKTYELLKKNEVISSDKKKYEGGRNAKGEPHGFGKMIYPNGDIYEGQWINGVRNGKGIYKYANGNVYEGDWKDNTRNGIGTLKNADGNIYEGNWVNGNRSKTGKLTLSSGTIYEGEWANDKRNGQGKITYGEASSYGHGNVYDGGWKDDEKHGEGVFTNALDNNELTQTWENGDLINSEGYGTITDINDPYPSPNIRKWHIYSSSYLENEIFTTNGTYIGEIKNNIPNGKGSFKISGESTIGTFDITYIGDWLHGKIHGNGVYILDYKEYDGVNSESVKYDGVWKEGIFCQGLLSVEATKGGILDEWEGVFRNGELWDGNYRQNNNSSSYRGSFINGREVD